MGEVGFGGRGDLDVIDVEDGLQVEDEDQALAHFGDGLQIFAVDPGERLFDGPDAGRRQVLKFFSGIDDQPDGSPMDGREDDACAKRFLLAWKAEARSKVQSGDDLAAGKDDPIDGGIGIGHQRHMLEHFDMLDALAGNAVNAAGQFEQHVGLVVGAHNQVCIA